MRASTRWVLAACLAACGDDLPNPGLQVVDGGVDGCVTAPSDEDADDSCGRACPRQHPHTSEPTPHISSAYPASAYNSSPPSSGAHCGEWSRYGVAYERSPLPACYFLHNLEHGAVVLLYNCPEGCPEIVEALEGLLAAPPADPDCAEPRVILTPYAEMDAKVAAAAWGYTYTTDCFDDGTLEELRAFITAYQGSSGDAPERQICAHGSIVP